MRLGVERIALMTALILLVSCSASKQNGFTYRPAYTGPDVAGTIETPAGSEELNNTTALPQPLTQSLTSTLSGEENEIAADLAKIIDQQMLASSSAGKVEAKKVVNNIAEAYAAENNIQLTHKQLRKLEKYGARLEKKQQKMGDVEWGPKNNLEIFLLAAAGVGLVVGFFSAIGWFVFLVAALVYLYLKLLKD